jgi:signal recognition particle subunit SRP54
MTGQDAVNVAESFHATLELDGVILTKLDGDARGGAALSVKEVVGKPIAFASVGEKLADFETFHPDRMASRILGMGDVLTLIEKAEQQMDRQEAEADAKRLMSGKFTYEDFLKQMRMIKRMGPLSGLLGMIPGLDKQLAGAQIDDRMLGRVEAMVTSMTAQERSNPKLLQNPSRVRRIARGSGATYQEVQKLIKQFGEMQKMMRQMGKGGGLPKMPRMPFNPR